MTTSAVIDDLVAVGQRADVPNAIEAGEPAPTWRDPVDLVATVLGALGVVGIMVLVVADVSMRFFLNSPLEGTVERVAYWLMLPATAFGIVAAQRRRDHVDVTAAVARFGELGRTAVHLASSLVYLALTVGFTWYAAVDASHRVAVGETAGATGVEISLTRWFMPAAFAVLSAVVAWDVLGSVRALSARGPSLGERLRSLAPATGFVASTVGSVVALGLPIVPEAKGAIALVLMSVLLLAGMPVAVTMAVAGLAAMWGLAGLLPMERTLVDVPFTGGASWSLSVLPMFIFMGLVLWASGATRRLYDAARMWLGWMPGGLAVTTTAAGAGLAAASGSTVGITHALARIGLPEMLRSGYDRRIALGSVIMCGLAGQLIPPSVLLVVYAGIAQVPVGPQLVAGIVPGLVLAASLCCALVLWCAVRPSLAPRAEVTEPLAVRVRALGAALPVPVLSALVVGGMLSGVFTATEAGAFGCVGAILLAVLLMRRPADIGRSLWSALSSTVSSVGQIMFLIIGAALLTRGIALSGLPVTLTEAVNGMGLGRVGFLVVLVVLYLVLGTFLEPIPMMLMTIPFLLPVLEALDVDLIWFGIFVVLLGELGMVTPPVGILVFIVHKIAQHPAVRGATEIRLSDVYVAATWLLVVPLLVVLALIAFPGMVSLLSPSG